MNRRQLLLGLGATFVTTLTACRGTRFGRILKDDDGDMVGSTSAGASTFNPLIDESVAKLLGRHGGQFHQVSDNGLPMAKPRICFVGIENKSSEELGDFRDHIYQQIDTQISQSQVFQPISPRFIGAALHKTGLRIEDLLDKDNMRLFAAALEEQGQPFEYMLYAVLTSGTTTSNRDYQRDYLLTMELVNPHTGSFDKESARIRKGYHHSRVSKAKHYNWFTRRK